MNLFLITICLISLVNAYRISSESSNGLDFSLIKYPYNNYTYQRCPQIKYLTENIPHRFDSRKNWPACRDSISNIRSQSYCKSSWAVATTSTISDRICIKSKGRRQVKISALDLMTCLDNSYDCSCGGNDFRALEYWIEKGIVSGGNQGDINTCRPYPTDNELRKPLKCEKTCVNGADYEEDKYYGKSFCVMDNELDIQKEIMKNGPVLTSLSMSDELKQYFYDNPDGIFQGNCGDSVNHAVRVIGWGVRDGVKFWLIANSLGTNFADNGLFRIERGANKCYIEAEAISPKPRLPIPN